VCGKQNNKVAREILIFISWFYIDKNKARYFSSKIFVTDLYQNQEAVIKKCNFNSSKKKTNVTE